MKTLSDSINVCLVTNRGCNLRCKHCYIEPELLASKNFMTDHHYRMVYQRVLELYDLDNRTTEINLETVGGEPTFLPFEYWERNLPYSVEMARVFYERTGRKSPFILNSNLIIRDQRYFDLFKEYSKDDGFELFISWEPDTQRYGSRDRLYKKYVEGIGKLGNGFRTLSLVVTKKLIEMGAQRVVDEHVVPHNFQDIAAAMLFQFGSGKTFFDEHMPTFSQISSFFVDLAKALPVVMNCDGEPDEVTMSPYEEIKQSLLLGRPFQFMGNDHYDLEIEPDGSTSFNSSMTGSEAQWPTRVIHVEDDLWNVKVLFENTPMLNKKLNGRYDFCRQCTFQRYCLGGYYHYKLLDRSLIDDLREQGEGDCPGYKRLWEHAESELAEHIRPVYEANFYRSMAKAASSTVRKKMVIRTQTEQVTPEAALAEQGYDQFLKNCLDHTGIVLIDKPIRFQKTIEERLWFYDSLGLQITFTDEISTDPALENTIKNIVHGNFKTLAFTTEFLQKWLQANSTSLTAKDIGYVLRVVKGLHSIRVANGEGASKSAEGLWVDDRNTELFQWAHFVDLNPDLLSCAPLYVEISERSFHELESMIDFAQREHNMKVLLNA